MFSPATPNVPINGVVNAASLAVYAEGNVVIGGTITAGNSVTISITGATATTPTKYDYIVKSTDTLETVAVALAGVINAGSGDPNVSRHRRSRL